MTFLLLLTIFLNACRTSHIGYKPRCPHVSHWYKRAKQFCINRERFYHCLQDMHAKKFTERCFEPDDLPPGYKSVYNNNLDARRCSYDRFSPFVTWSNSHYQCTFAKSVCVGEGQRTYKTGSSTEDSTCHCDYTRGYRFVVQPANICYCLPNVEECTCYLHTCSRKEHHLSADYSCSPENENRTITVCDEIKIITQVRDNTTIVTVNKDIYSYDNFDGRLLVAGIACFIICCLFISFLLLYFMKEFEISNSKQTPETRTEQNSKRIVEELLTEMSFFPAIQKVLKDRSLLILKGRKGTGKTTIASYLKSVYEKEGYKILECDKDFPTDNIFQNKFLVYADDFDCLRNDGVLKWLKHILEPLVKYNGSGKLILTLTSFPQSFSDAIAAHFHLADVIIDMDTCYSLSDREIILQSYLHMKDMHVFDKKSEGDSLEHNTVCFSSEIFNSIIKEDTFMGFPSMCQSFCSHKNNIELGIRYFRQPPEELITTFDRWKTKGQEDMFSAYRYCLLIGVLICADRNLNMQQLINEEFCNVMVDIYETMHNPYEPKLVENLLSSLTPDYLVISEYGNLSFSHPAVYQAAMISYSQLRPLTVIMVCNISDIMTFHRPVGYRRLHNEVILRDNFSQDQRLVRRITDNILETESAQVVLSSLRRYVEEFDDVDLLQLVAREMNLDVSENYNARLLFFDQFSCNINKYSNIIMRDVYTLNIAWRYLCSKLNMDTLELNDLGKELSTCDLIREVLLTCVDKYKNTLLHYFVVWNSFEEKEILSSYVSKLLTRTKAIQTRSSMSFSTICNILGHTPLHFAAYLGRYDFFSKLKRIEDMESSTRDIYTHFRKFRSVLSTTYCLLKSGEKHQSKEVEAVMDLQIKFEFRLTTSSLGIKFGNAEQFESIVLLLGKYPSLRAINKNTD